MSANDSESRCSSECKKLITDTFVERALARNLAFRPYDKPDHSDGRLR
jgi:hypothetical protein